MEAAAAGSPARAHHLPEVPRCPSLTKPGAAGTRWRNGTGPGHRLGLDPAKVVDVVGEFANTSAASLPIALAAARRDGRLHDGDQVLLAAFGAGLVWGGVVVTWGLPPATAAD